MIGAFLIGLFGSFHCIGMCSPMMVALTKGGGNIKSFSTYHLSRIVVYIFFGFIVGVLGVGFNTFAYQQSASIIGGVLVILIYAFPKWRNKVEGVYYRSKFYNRIKGRFLPLYQSKFRWLAAGTLNGFLPCGLIYLALAGAMMEAGLLESMIYMLTFGIGTLPALALIASFRSRIGTIVKQFPIAATILPMCVGLIMVLRGVLIHSPDFNQLITSKMMNAISYCGF